MSSEAASSSSSSSSTTEEFQLTEDHLRLYAQQRAEYDAHHAELAEVLAAGPGVKKITAVPNGDMKSLVSSSRPSEYAKAFPLIENLTYDQLVAKRTTGKYYRLDRQDATPNEYNMQIQKNDVGAPSTVSTVLFPDSYVAKINSSSGAQKDSRIKELTRNAQAAFQYSLVSWRDQNGTTIKPTQYLLVGDFSS